MSNKWDKNNNKRFVPLTSTNTRQVYEEIAQNNGHQDPQNLGGAY